MNQSSKIAKESAISFSGMAIGQILRYLFTTFLARWSGPELLGIYSISNAVTRITEVIGKLGLDQGVIRAVSREEQFKIKQLKILSALKIGIITGIIFMCIQIIIANWLVSNFFDSSDLLGIVISMHAISLPFYIIIHISANSTQAFKLLKYKIFVTEIQNPFLLLVGMFICYYYFSIESVIILPIIFSSIIGFITINIFLKKISKVNILSIRKGFIDLDLINYSLPIMLIAVLGTVLHWTDIIMLGYFLDSKSVGIYHPAARTAGILRIVLTSFAGIYGPIMAEMYFKNQQDKMNHLFKLVSRWIITFAIPFAILIFLFPRNIMLIFGDEFISGYNILIILTFSTFIQAIFGISGTTLNMTGFPKVNLVNTIIACGLNIVLNIVLIPLKGVEGAAIATLITLIFIALLRGIQNWILIRLFPFNIKVFKPILSGLITAGLVYYIKLFIINFHFLLSLFFAGLIIFSIYFLILWILGLDKDDSSILFGLKSIINFKKNN